MVGIATRMLSSRAQLQEALRAAGRVVGALALVAVRQQQRQRRLLAPLHLAGGDELVDDRLGAVDEVAELRLPQHQRVGVLHRVAVLEAHRRVLAEQRVVHEEPGVVRWPAWTAAGSPCRSARRRSTACRWTNVPRRESWPASRTVTPWASSEPNAMISPKPQSMSPSTAILARRSSSCWTRLCGVKPSGRSTCASPTACTTDGVDRGVDLAAPAPARRSRARRGGGAGARRGWP